MATSLRRRFGFVWIACVLLAGAATRAHADEIWVAPTSQADVGGLGVASNAFWPVTPIGVVRLAWAIPNDLQTFQSAKIAMIPGAPAGGPPALHFYVCAAQNGTAVSSDCTGPFVQTFTNAPNQLTEVEIGGVLSAHIGTPGSNYLAILAYTTPATATDHIVGLRFTYAPAPVAGVPTLASNTFTGTQTASAFVGDGAGLSNVAKLGANTFSGTQTAPAFAGSGASLTGVAKLTANTFTGTQTIDSGNLDLDASTATTGTITTNGVRFLHNFGSQNVFLGLFAGNFTLTGDQNTAIGFQALASDTTGLQNTATGAHALGFNTTGQVNTAVGNHALQNNTTGCCNTASGHSALETTTTGGDNSAMGFLSLSGLTSGDSNTAVGALAGSDLVTGSNNIYLGAFVRGLSTESNSMYLGKVGTHTKTFVAGVRGITTVNANAVPVMIDSAGQLGTVSSSIRFKEDIHDMGDMSHRLFNLRPITFRYTKPYANGSKPIQFGLVAEEVAEAFPELAVRDANGNVETVHYETLNVLLLNELKKEHDEAQQQRQRIDMLEQRLNELMIQRTTTQP